MSLLGSDSVLFLMLPCMGADPVQEERMSVAAWLCRDGGERPWSSPALLDSFLPLTVFIAIFPTGEP